MEKDLCRGLYMFCLIYTISKLRCAFSESRKCMPFSRLHNTLVQSRDCMSTVNKRNGLTGWEHLSWLQKRVESSSSCWSLELGHSTGLGSLCAHIQTEGKGVSQSWPGAGAWVYMPDIDGDDRAAQAPYICSLRLFLTFMLDGNLNDDLGSIAHATEIVQSWDSAPVPCDLEIAHWCSAISRLCKPSSVQSWDWRAVSGFWDCAVQSWDCTNS